MRPRRAISLLVLCLVPVRLWAAASAEQAATAERVLALLRGVASEYGEAFDADGTLARPIELEEASLLVAEARGLAPKIGLAEEALDPLSRSLATHASEAAVAEQIGALEVEVTAATGVRAESLPPAAPSAARGAVVFQENCSGCHGAEGRGDGAESRRLGLAPANFADPAFVRRETPEDFFNVVTLGRRRSGMPAWGEALSVQDRWDVIRQLWTVARPPGEVERGREVLGAECGGCHASAAMGPSTLTRTSDADLFARLEDATVGRGAHARLASLSAPDRWAAVAAMRERGFDGLVGGADAAARPRTPADPVAALAEVHRLVDAALAARRSGDPNALGLATDAYMRFEPFERRLGGIDPGLVRRIEEGFVGVRQALRAEGSEPTLAPLVATLHRDLDAAVATLAPGAGAWVRFAQSAGIILREGFEVVLVVGALLAYVRRSGEPAMVRSLYVGSAAGVVASIVTAAALVTLFRMTPWAGEALEGGAMLLAAVVLFWVSYWLVSKAEADRWQRYIRGKVQHALSAGSGTALASAAFLAVYREGFETILFYQALFASAPTGDVMVPAGLLAGLVALAVVYLGLERIGLRIPMRAFFLGTGGFLYAMAIVFAGRGVAELQEAGLVPLTPLPGAPRLEILGVYPTVESLVAQGVFVLLLAYAIAVTVARRRRAAAPLAETAAEPPRRRKALRS